MVAQAIDQRRARLDLHAAARAVDQQLDLHWRSHRVRVVARLQRARGRRARRRRAAGSRRSRAGCDMISIDATAARTASRDLARPTGAIRSARRRRRRAAAASPSRRRCRARRPCTVRHRSSATCAAAATSAKSLRRALTSWKPTPTRCLRARPESGSRSTQSPCVIAVIIGPTKKSSRRDRCAAVPRCAARCSPLERRQHQRNLGGRIGVRDRAADRAAIARGGMSDERQRQREQRHLAGDQWSCVRRGDLTRRRADRDRVRRRHECRAVRRCARCRSAASAARAASPSWEPASARRR